MSEVDKPKNIFKLLLTFPYMPEYAHDALTGAVHLHLAKKLHEYGIDCAACDLHVGCFYSGSAGRYWQISLVNLPDRLWIRSHKTAPSTLGEVLQDVFSDCNLGLPVKGVYATYNSEFFPITVGGVEAVNRG